MAVLVSLGITAAWAAFSHEILTALGLANVPGMGTVLGVIGIAVTLVADAVLFFFVLVRMPDVDVPLRIGIRGALLAAVGFELLKIIGTYTVAASAQQRHRGAVREPAGRARVDPAGHPVDAVQRGLDGRGHAGP